MSIADGKKIANQIEEKLKKQVDELKSKNITPKLVVFLVGDNKASATYVRKKGEAAKRVGFDFDLKELDKNIAQEELVKEIKKAQKEKLSGLMVQLPLPKHLNSQEIINQINPKIDIDCLTENSWGKLAQGTHIFEPPTAGAMMEIIRQHQVDLKGKEVVVVGTGELVGKPLVLMLLRENCTITACNIYTKDLAYHTKKADVIFSGVGKYNLITGEMIKDGVVIIDAGVSFNEGKMYGDIDFESISQKASLITPTPGGVGPITVAKLLENTVKSAILMAK
jgi:methylenetetrahydrofolate dehydrogenase (NADP+)/methenyltetrahydrofolate cyclohydrolase